MESKTTASLDKKVLRGWDSAAISIGIVIGVGIFSTPAEVAKLIPEHLVLIAWLVGGLLSLVGALCYGELASVFPKTGGEYIFLREAYGKLVAFAYAWTDVFIVRAGSIASIALIFGMYGTHFIAGMNASDSSNLAKILAIGCVFFLTALNAIGLSTSKVVQDVVTAAKVLALLAVACAGLFAPGHAASETSQMTVTTHSFLLALVPILWTFGGWHEAVFVAGETKDAKKTLPKTLVATVLLVLVIYLLMNYGYLKLLSYSEISSTDSVASLAFQRIFGENGARLLSTLIMVGSIGSLNGMVITGSRVTYAVSADNRLFQFFSVCAKNGAPLRALCFNAIGACLLVLVGKFEQLLFYTGFAVWLFHALCVISIFIQRKRIAEPRTFSVPLYPGLPAIYALVCIAISVNTIVQYWEQSFIGMGIIAGGVIVYLVTKRWNEVTS